MSLEQNDLPLLSEHYYSVAGSIAGQQVQPRRLFIADMEYGTNREIFWKRAPKAGPALSGLALIAKLKDLAPYRAHTRESSRKNSTTVAWVGASALSHVHIKAEQQAVRFSPQAMSGIQNVLQVVHKELEATFFQVARKDSDTEALYFLAQSQRLLHK